MILAPAAPSTAPKVGSSLQDPLKMYLSDVYTAGVNLAGLPAISVPAGKDRNGMPVGLQFIGDCFKEKKIIQAAYAYEKSVEYFLWHIRRRENRWQNNMKQSLDLKFM